MAEHDLHTIGTATFEEVSMLPRNILLRNQAAAVGDIRYTSKLASNLYLVCTTAGTTSSSPVSLSGKGEGASVTDGTAVFTVAKIGSGGGIYYATCSTAAATAAKVATCNGFRLTTGAAIAVKFTYANTAASPTLNVNSTGAKAIWLAGAAIGSGTIQAGQVCEFVYDGTRYNIIGSRNVDTANTANTANTAYNIPTTSGLGNIWIE